MLGGSRSLQTEIVYRTMDVDVVHQVVFARSIEKDGKSLHSTQHLSISGADALSNPSNVRNRM